MKVFENLAVFTSEFVDQFMLALAQLYRSAKPNTVDREV